MKGTAKIPNSYEYRKERKAQEERREQERKDLIKRIAEVRRSNINAERARERVRRLWLKALIGVGLNSLRVKRIIRVRQFQHVAKAKQEQQELDDTIAEEEKALREGNFSGDSALLRKHINLAEEERKNAKAVPPCPSVSLHLHLSTPQSRISNINSRCLFMCSL